MNTITEHEALTNMARGLNLTIHEKHQTDGRKKIKEYFAQRDKATLSPVLPFEKLNLFLMGWRRAADLTPVRIDLKNTYFAEDGAYGNHFLVVNTDKWTEADWERIENCTDSERMKRAYAIAKAKGQVRTRK